VILITHLVTLIKLSRISASRSLLMFSSGVYPETFEKPGDFHHPKKTMDCFEVTGGRVLSFRNVAVGEFCPFRAGGSPSRKPPVTS
jgi:hypothetical protein